MNWHNIATAWLNKYKIDLDLEVVDEVVRVVVDPDEGVEGLEVPAVLGGHALPRHHEVGARRRSDRGHGVVVRVHLAPYQWENVQKVQYLYRQGRYKVILLTYIGLVTAFLQIPLGWG